MKFQMTFYCQRNANMFWIVRQVSWVLRKFSSFLLESIDFWKVDTKSTILSNYSNIYKDFWRRKLKMARCRLRSMISIWSIFADFLSVKCIKIPITLNKLILIFPIRLFPCWFLARKFKSDTSDLLSVLIETGLALTDISALFPFRARDNP